MTRCTGSPAARTLAASASRSPMPGCGASPVSSSGLRRTPSSRRVSDSACRALFSIFSRVASARLPDARAPAACSTITLR